ncbi:GNAT family N-acetyltransferase [Alishewanella tabrizica]|uniref:N-acetyltransferase GCN5 n=1 Tax=Alishewanella tabrizica TaxID=671278 RepID=A0ABQ2WFQ3_9ALTE|nr:GNAT family N-acetyltransferase [Alishewanella tabrizica]GGW52584.1 N-acetyltransferase GCN5 [Alishewanella tabrizica]
MSNKPTLTLLKHYPEHIPEIAKWHFQEWGELFPEKSEADFASDLAATLNDGTVPLSWVLMLDEQVVGTASILLDDMQTNRDLSPWLANIYLAPAARGKGLGKWLVQQVMLQAQQLGLTKLYLFTEDKPEFYQQFGWQPLKQERYEGTLVTIMYWHN